MTHLNMAGPIRGQGAAPASGPRRAFTLVELLVVITIIGILIALLLPAVQSAREAGRRAQCSNNMKQFGAAFVHYNSHHGVFPPGRMSCDGWNSNVCAGLPGWRRPGHSGFVCLLPFLELTSIHDQFQPFEKGALFPAAPGDVADGTTNGWQTPQIAAVLGIRPSVFVCPSDDSQPLMGANATNSYAMCAGTNGPTFGIDAVKVKHYNTGVFLYRTLIQSAHIRDGLSNTFFVGETILNHTTESANRIWIAGRHMSALRTTNNPLNTKPTEGIVLDLYGYKCSGAFASRHPGGATFVFGDGHIAWINENIDMATYQALSTRAGKDVVKAP